MELVDAGSKTDYDAASVVYKWFCQAQSDLATMHSAYREGYDHHHAWPIDTTRIV